jgi:superfamily II DNA/RNA helicase
VLDFCDKVLADYFNVEFARVEELKSLIRQEYSYIKQLTKYQHDTKFNKLLEIIETASEKIVVFCIYQETARALTEQIKQALPDVEVACNITSSNIDEMIQQFAPIANEVPEELRKDDIQVLVATGALTEGYNLQDAAILVNYDLPWTVLQLAQRMGRILRPWHEPREITIYNFMPTTMQDERVTMALAWEKRLEHRGDQFRSFAEIPVLLRKEELQKEWEMIELAHELQTYGEVALDLQQIMDFIEHAEHLQTTSFYDDLAQIPQDKAIELKALPPGIKTAKVKKGEKRLFILLKYNRKFFPVMFDKKGNILSAGHPDKIMEEIRSSRNEVRAPFKLYPDDSEFDSWIENSKQNWAFEESVVDTNNVQIICVMALVPPA